MGFLRVTYPLSAVDRTPIYGLPFLAVGAPARYTRAVLEDATYGIEAALARGGVAPAGAADLATLTARVGELGHNVMRYGAKGDGATDDQPAAQAALDAAAAAGGGVVVFPAGRSFLIRSRLTVRANTTIWAYGATIIKATPTFAFLRNFDQTADSFPAYTGNSNITVAGGTWKGNAQNQTTGTSGNFFSFAHCEHITVRDATFIDACADAHAVEFNAVRRSSILNCRAYGFKSVTGTQSEAFQFDLANAAALCQPQDNTPCSDILFSGNTVAASAALPSWPRMVGAHNAQAGVFPLGFRILGNSAIDCTDVAIRVYQWSDVVVANNFITGPAGIGIQVRGGDAPNTTPLDRIVVASNVIRDAGGDGIQIMGVGTSHVREIVVASNMVAGSRGDGISANLAYGIAVTGNQVTVTSGAGVKVVSCDFAVVEANRVRGTGSHGITFSELKSGQITGNTVRTAATYGIILSPNAIDCAVRGNYVGAATSGAYRASAGSNWAAFTGNSARLDGLAAFAGSALSITSGCTGVLRHSNDFSGHGATGISDAGVTPVTSTADRV
jgi:hypothetical protein